MSRSQKHILVAEDDTFLMKLMQMAIESHGIRVSSARNGREAIAIIEKDPPDLLLLDLLMPGIDGFGVLQHCKERYMHFPVIICSNLSDTMNRDKCTEFGVNAYLVKSDMDESQLWPVIEKYLQ
ncbi:MAG: response regulator [Candidatus Peregrinibacteria bacterium]